MTLKRILTLQIAFVFTALCVSVLIPVSTEAATSTAAANKTKCERRVKLITNRGKKMAKDSKKLHDRYKKVSQGWNNKVKVNRDYAAKYSPETNLEAQVADLNTKINDFQGSVKAYNAAKKDYITERNAQVKSYKHFKADCSNSDGRRKASAKMQEFSKTDRKVLMDKAKNVNEVYKAKVRPSILTMRDSRGAVIEARKNMNARAEVAPTSEIDELVTDEMLELDDEADDLFDMTEFEDATNLEVEVPAA